MKIRMLFITIIACSSFTSCSGQNQDKHDLNILYIVEQDGGKIYTGHLIILPKDIDSLTVLSKQDVLYHSVSSDYDVVFEVKPGANVKLMNRQMLLDTFKIKHEQADFPIQVDGRLLTSPGDLLAEYAAISKMEVNTINHRIEMTTVLPVHQHNSNEKLIH